MRQSTIWLTVAALGWSWVACEPTSITEARNQLGRGPDRSLRLSIPIAAETLVVGDLLDSMDVNTTLLITPQGDTLVGVPVDPETLSVAVGEKLRFDNLGFDPFTFGYGQMLQTSEATTSVTLSLAPPPAQSSGAGPGRSGHQQLIRFNTPDGSSLVSATIGTGRVVRRIDNGTSCAADVTMSLVDSTGATVASFPSTPVAAGGTVNDSTNVDGVTVTQFVQVDLAGTAQGACVPTPGESISASVTFRPMTLLQVTLTNVREGFTQSYDFLSSERRVRVIDTVVVDSGGVSLQVANRLPIELNVKLVLKGIRETGDSLVRSVTIAAAPGDGTTRSTTIALNLAGLAIVPGAARATVTGVASTPAGQNATFTPAVTTDAVVVSGTGSLRIRRLAGRLDPDSTPELRVHIAEAQELPKANIDLGEFEDVVRDADLNSVRVELTVTNGADVPVTLSNFQIGAVRIDPATGRPAVDANGNFVFERDAAGNPLLVTRTINITRQGVTGVVLDDAATVALMNRVVDLVLDDIRVALAGVGTAVVGDGTIARVTNTDVVRATIALTVGLDFTVPASGLTFDENVQGDGLDLDSAAADDLVRRIDSATATLRVDNGTPFSLEAMVAAVGDSIEGDVFAAPGRILLDTLRVAPGSVDANGRITSAARDTARVSLTGQEIRTFLGPKFTAGVRVKLLPPAGGRGALRRSDQVIVRASAAVVLRAGGAR